MLSKESSDLKPREANKSVTHTWSIRLVAISFLFYILIIIKGSDRLFHAAIWAEDGKIFLKQSFELGWASLFIPYDGYFHTVPRLITLVATWLPVSIIPYFIVLACYAIFAFMACLILFRPYNWLFEKQEFAIVCSTLLVLSPGQIVMLGNTANIHWYLLFILALYGLKSIDQPFSITELIIAFLCVASEGAALILLPLFISRILLKPERRISNYYGELIIIVLLLLFTFVHISIANSSSEYTSFSSYFKIFQHHFLYFFILHIFTGDALISYISSHAAIVQIYACIVSVGLIYFLKKVWKRELVLLIVLSVCSLLLPIMIAMARPQNFEILRTYFDYNTYEWFRFRYSFFVPAVASVFWCAILSRISAPKWLPHSIVGLIIIAQVYSTSYRIPIYRYEEFKDWHKKAPLLEKSLQEGCPRTVHIQINPVNWSVIFKSPIDANCNEDQ